MVAAHMAITGPRGMRRSELLAWPRDDLHLQMVWQQQQAEVHPPCGTRPDEWDPERGGHDHAYVAEIRGCRGCETLASAEKQVSKELAAMGGHVVLVRNPEAT